MKSLHRWSGIIALIVACGYFLIYIFDHWSQLPTALGTPEVLAALTVAPFIYFCAFLTTASAWSVLLDSMGQNLQPTRALAILLVSQFAKYLPGNVGHHIGRVSMAHTAGMASGLVVLTITMEASGAILAALSIGFLALTVNGAALLGGPVDLPSLSELAAFGLAAFLVPIGAILLIKHLPNTQFRRLFGPTEFRLPGFRSLVTCYVLYVFGFLILGAVLYLLASTLTEANEGHFLFLTGVFAAAWVAGFVTPGAPAGMGVREAILIASLDPVYGAVVALSLAIGLRLVTTIGDAIGFLVGLALRYWLR